MKQYCVITRDNKELIIVETQKLSYLNEKNNLRPITDDIDLNEYNGSFCIKHGESLLNGLEIIDCDDDLVALKCRNSGKEKRIRILKSAYSPGISKASTRRVTDTEANKKNYLKNPAASASRLDKTAVTSAGSKHSKVVKPVVQSSGEYYRNLLPKNKNPDPEDDAQSEEHSESSESNHPEEIMEADGDDNFEHDDEDNDSDDTPRRALSDLTNKENQGRQGIKLGNIIRRKGSRNLRSMSWRVGVDKTLQSLKKDIKNLVQASNSGSCRQSAEGADDAITDTQLVEKITVENEVEFTEIEGVRFDANEYSSTLLATTMKSRAGRVMNVMWTTEQMKKMYLMEPKTSGEFTKVTARDVTIIKRLCKHLQKKYRIRYAPGSADDIDIHIRRWISSKLAEKKREPRTPRHS